MNKSNVVSFVAGSSLCLGMFAIIIAFIFRDPVWIFVSCGIVLLPPMICLLIDIIKTPIQLLVGQMNHDDRTFTTTNNNVYCAENYAHTRFPTTEQILENSFVVRNDLPPAINTTSPRFTIGDSGYITSIKLNLNLDKHDTNNRGIYE